MGGFFSSDENVLDKYRTSKEIEKAIEMDTIKGVNKKIDMTEENFNNPFQHKYIIKIHSENLKVKIYILFPTHPVQKKRWLSTDEYSTCAKLCLEINNRLQEQVGDKSVIITVGDQVYQLENIKGRIYFLWSERINQQTINRQDNEIEEFIPLIIETNGQYKERNIILLNSGLMLNLKDVTIIEPFHYSLYCCESDSRKDKVHFINTLSNSKADLITKEKIVRSLVTLDKEEIPFSTSDEEGDLKMIPNTERHINYHLSKNEEENDEK